MNRLVWILLAFFAGGLIIVSLPDSAPPVIRLNETHGPSWPDLAGLSFMLLSWITSVIVLIIRRKKVLNTFGKTNVYMLILLYLVLLSGMAIALSISSEWILWSCAAIAFMINIAFLIPAFRRN